MIESILKRNYASMRARITVKALITRFVVALAVAPALLVEKCGFLTRRGAKND